MKRILIASDIHRVNGKDRLEEVLGILPKGAFDAALIGGDLVGLAAPNRDMPEEERKRNWTPDFSVREFDQRLKAVLQPGAKAYYTYGSHDLREAAGRTSFLAGPVDLGECWLYGISFAEMKFAREEQRAEDHRGHGYDGIDPGCAEEAAARFLKWAHGLKDHKPILVMSHVPLHAHRQDNLGAQIWTEALNSAGKKHDILFFFGHNHTAERKTALDRQFYLAPAGEKLPIQSAERECAREIPLNFTYANAGYIVHGCCSSVTVEEDRIILRRHAVQKEQEAFGDTGIPSPWILQRQF